MPLVTRTFHLGPLDNNAYLLVCEASREAAVMDVGWEPDVVVAALRELGVQVRLLLNTHGHYDHVAGMRVVQAACGGDYWLHPADRPLLDLLSEQGTAFGFPPASAPRDPHDLADGQTLRLGDEKLEVIHTPGHSPGGVCFRHGETLWSGDTLFAGSVGRTDLPGGSFEALERAIRERIFPLGDAVRVLPGHGPHTTIGDERRNNPFVGEGAARA